MNQNDSTTPTVPDQTGPRNDDRHARLWKLIVLLTAAVLVLTIIPYISSAEDAGIARFLPPVISSWLVVFVLLRIRKNLDLFADAGTYLPDAGPGGRELEIGAIAYLVMLAVLAFMHFIYLANAYLVP